MSDSGKQIKDRFSDFEPDVDDATVDKGWEKIRYFLPQEKKRRGGFFFRAGGQRKLFTILTALGLGLGIVAGLTWLSDPEKEHAKVQQEWAGAERASTPALGKIEPAPDKDASEKLTGNVPVNGDQDNEAKDNPAAGRKTDYTAPVHHVVTKKTANTKSHLPLILQGIVGAASPSASVTNNQVMESILIADQPEKREDLTVVTPKEDSLPYVVLSSIPYKAVGEETTLMNVTPIPFPEISAKRKWILEVFAGSCHPNTNVQEQGNTLLVKDKPAQFSAGLGLAYQFHSKWKIDGELRISGNRLEQVNETELRNRIIEKRLSISSALPSLVPDTAILYVQANARQNIESRLSYQASLGIDYTVLQRKKWAFEVFARFALRYGVYTFNSQDQQGTDTLYYLRSGKSGPLTNSETSRVEEYHQQNSIMSIGLMPGIAASYQISSRMSLLVKPSGFIQLSQNKLSVVQKQFSLRQNAVFIDLGLRIKL